MYALLLATLLGAGVAGAADTEKAAPKLDGKWLIVYSEEDGRRNTAWESKVATMSGNKLTYEADKKKRALELTFGQHQTVKVKFSADDAKDKVAFHGVAIIARDYLCLSLNPEKSAKSSDIKAKSSATFILILRRQREK